MMPRLVLLLAVAAKTAALSQKNWLKLPDINPGRLRSLGEMHRGLPRSAVATPIAASAAQKTASRRAGDIQQWPRIPVWPSWAGGRVIPMGLPNADPFLLVAHHKHWFDPRDPLRGPFRAFGKATGLPYCGGRAVTTTARRWRGVGPMTLPCWLGRWVLNQQPRHRAGGASMAWGAKGCTKRKI